MTPIPPKIRKLMDEDPFYKTCAMYGHVNHTCAGRITMDHSFIYAGNQLQELWAIGPFCCEAHGVDGYKDTAEKKEIRLWVALNRATDAELTKVSKAVDMIKYRDRLNNKWGEWYSKVPNPSDLITPQPEASKKDWYLITKEDKTMIEKIRGFERAVLGYSSLPRETIKMCIENRYLECRDQLLEQDPALFKMLGFV